VIAQKWSIEAVEIADEPDEGTSTDGGDLDNLMKTIKGMFHFVYYFYLLCIVADSQSHLQLLNDYPLFC
jgi:hypothetical protein